MLSKEEIENNRIPKQLAKELGIEKEDTDSLIVFKKSLYEQTMKAIVKLKKQVEQLKSDKQKLIEKLEERIQSVEKCYQDLIKPYYDKKLNIVNTSFMIKKEKEEFTNKRNCLLVQKHCYQEILEIEKGIRNGKKI